ncbi:CBO0543 family protein [Halobacillus ihumii]|uniref:CBO0543 family protein n=1 Tax=Halobacillus ihumii TaxID=2686092 RepID=UPI0013D52CFC|nr:CBO0543 family protein [Halobacillus ihumii]
MESIILWLLLIIGVILLIFIMTKLPFMEFLFGYLLTSYFAIVIGVLVVEEKMIDYPDKFLQNHFDSSLLFEYLLFPVVCLFFYRTSYHSSRIGILLQAALYTAALTAMELTIERYTSLVEYSTWTGIHTFFSVLIFMIFIRVLLQLLRTRTP